MKPFSRLMILLVSFITYTKTASAQLIDSDLASNFTDEVQVSSGFSDVSLGYVIATILGGFMGLLGVTFLILMVLAGFRWMNSGGNEETIKKAQETIKNSIIGLILVLAAWAITFFIFKMLPFGATSGGGRAVIL